MPPKVGRGHIGKTGSRRNIREKMFIWDMREKKGMWPIERLGRWYREPQDYIKDIVFIFL